MKRYAYDVLETLRTELDEHKNDRKKISDSDMLTLAIEALKEKINVEKDKRV